MARIIKMIVLSLFFFLSLRVHAEMSAYPYTDMVKKTMNEFMEKNQIPGAAVLLYVKGKPYAYYFGYADKAKLKPVTKASIFEIGSISKIMTALLLAEQIDFSKMQLNDSIKKYLPTLSQSLNGITLKQLATHTAGLAPDIPDTVRSEEDLQNFLAHLTLAHAPMQRWSYSSVGVGVLAKAIEKVSGNDLNQLYIKQILLPLGMQPIGMNVPKNLQADYAQGYDHEGKPVLPAKLGFFPGTHHVKVSAGDMQRFLGAAIGLPNTPAKIFYPMRMTQTAYVQIPDALQGLGWEIHPLTKYKVSALLKGDATARGVKKSEMIEQPTFSSDTLIDKAGVTDGFRAYIAVIPSQQSGIVILTNRYSVDSSVVKVGRGILLRVTQWAAV